MNFHERNDFVEKEKTKENIQKFILENENIIRNIVVSFLDKGSIGIGATDDFEWKQTFRSGKQQPVAIVKFSFLNSKRESFELVFRPTFNNFKDVCEKYPLVQKYFPSLYLNVPLENNLSVLVLERINGYEEKHNGIEFANYISNYDNFNQLCVESFEMVDEIYNYPLILEDIRPVLGHNVFFNTDTKYFQFFDVDTIKTSDLSYEQKFLEFIDLKMLGLSALDEKQIIFLMRMIQLYKEKYSDNNLSYETEEYVKGEYIKVLGNLGLIKLLG
jgi:hypothetical protein